MKDLALATALATVGNDLYFTFVRLLARPETKPLAPDVEKLLAQVDAVDAEHKARLRAIAKADAQAAGTRADVEQFATTLQVTALGVCKQDRQDPRFRTLFPDPASAVVAYDQAKLRKWLDGVATALPGMADKEFKALAGTAKQLLPAWDASEAAQAAAATANSQHDASVRTPLKAKVNNARRDLYADLTKLATKSGHGKRWVESFFRTARPAKQPAAPV